MKRQISQASAKPSRNSIVTATTTKRIVSQNELQKIASSRTSLRKVVEPDERALLVRIGEAEVGHRRVGHVVERPDQEDEDEQRRRQDQR